MAEARKRYILLQDRVGNTQEKSILSFGLSVKSVPTQLLKGELLEAFAETKQPDDPTRIALSRIDQKTLRVECDMGDIARLTDKDADLLLPISSAGLRYQTFIHRNRLDFGRQISLGSRVFVEVKGVSKKLQGTVCYIGELPPSHGTMFGVELIVSKLLFTYFM